MHGIRFVSNWRLCTSDPDVPACSRRGGQPSAANLARASRTLAGLVGPLGLVLPTPPPRPEVE